MFTPAVNPVSRAWRWPIRTDSVPVGRASQLRGCGVGPTLVLEARVGPGLKPSPGMQFRWGEGYFTGREKSVGAEYDVLSGNGSRSVYGSARQSSRVGTGHC